MGIPYALNNGNLVKFLKEIRAAAAPGKVDVNYLRSRGYTGVNDKALVAYLKALRFIDNSGTPLKRWHDHRHADQSSRVLGDAIREAYSGFFDIYADADRRPESDFVNWARVEEPSASPKTIQRAWGTFRTITKVATFGHMGSAESANSDNGADSDSTTVSSEGNGQVAAMRPVQVGAMGAITINIELQLPATADAKFFEEFFLAMRKHLIDSHE
jgi:hypothetical protein